MSDQPQQQQQKPGTKKRRRRDMDPAVKTSKALSWILRHGALTLKLDMGPDGYVPLAQLLASAHPKVRGMTFEIVQAVVTSNAKQRFSMIQRNGEEWFIRANQGHSITDVIDPYQLLTPISNLSALSTTIVHGTYLEAWTKHIQTQGLSKMNRTHIHFAKGVPTEEGVISGMRNSCTVFIYLDTVKCAADDDIAFFESSNGVVLTGGVNGILAPEFFSHVLSKSGEVLLDHRTP